MHTGSCPQMMDRRPPWRANPSPPAPPAGCTELREQGFGPCAGGHDGRAGLDGAAIGDDARGPPGARSRARFHRCECAPLPRSPTRDVPRSTARLRETRRPVGGQRRSPVAPGKPENAASVPATEHLAMQVVKADQRERSGTKGPGGGPISAIPVTWSTRRPAAVSSSRHSVRRAAAEGLRRGARNIPAG